MTSTERKAAVALYDQARELADAAGNIREDYAHLDPVCTMASDTLTFCRGVEALLWGFLDGKIRDSI